VKVIRTELPEVLILEPVVHGDPRGFFLESYVEKTFQEITGSELSFVQDNHSRSEYGVLRGLHMQVAPHAQGKLVRVAAGRVFDVAVDARPDSANFGRWTAAELSAENFRQFWIPPGFAHGFLVLSESADFLYKTTSYYRPAAEVTIRWDDPDIGVAWPLPPGEKPKLSERDAQAAPMRDVLKSG
jgi:dTDP-4-dehydrorhamnose 3,5-epimerase